MAIELRDDYDARMLRFAAKGSKNGPQARRLLALAAIYEGATRTRAAEIGGVTLQIIRDWVLKFNEFGPDGLIDRKQPGQARKAYLRAVISRIEVDDQKVRIIGDKATLADMIAGRQTQAGNVRGFVRNWRTRHDSNV